MAKRRTTPEWYRWCIEVGELVDQRDNIRDHKHSLGEKWEIGIIEELEGRIAALRDREPPRYEGEIE